MRTRKVENKLTFESSTVKRMTNSPYLGDLNSKLVDKYLSHNSISSIKKKADKFIQEKAQFKDDCIIEKTIKKANIQASD